MFRFLKFIATTFLLSFAIINLPVIGTLLCTINNPAKDVFQIIAESTKLHKPRNILLLGDSACRQVFGKKSNNDTLNLCENQAYEITGNYLLIENLLTAGNSFDTLILYFNPFSLTNQLDQIFTYNYFIKPFRPHLQKLDESEKTYISRTFPEESILEFLPFKRYEFSNWQYPTTEKRATISDTNFKYLHKIDALCKQKNIVFIFLSMPIKESRKNEIQQMVANSSRFLDQSQLLQHYFTSLAYLPDSLFQDGIHYLQPEKIQTLLQLRH